jgi:hypothetical protein
LAQYVGAAGRWKECQGKSDIVLHFKNILSRLFFFILSQKN